MLGLRNPQDTADRRNSEETDLGTCFFETNQPVSLYHVPIFSLLNRRFSLGIAYFETVPNGHGSNKLAANIGWFKTRVATTCGTFEEGSPE